MVQHALLYHTKELNFRVEPTFDQHSQYKMNHTVKGLHLRYNFSIIKHRTEEEERFTKKYQARQIVLLHIKPISQKKKNKDTKSSHEVY